MNAPSTNRGRRTAVHRAAGRGGRWLALFEPLFQKMLDRIDRGLETGAVEATLPDGRTRLLGGRAPGPVAIVGLASWRALVRLAFDGSAGWYVAWAKGEWTSPDPVPLFDLFMRNRVPLGASGRPKGWPRLMRRARHWLRRNDRGGARRNIAFHYDLGNDFYAAWLDPTLSYSSAIFADPAEPLTDAQLRKMERLAGRLDLKPGSRVLEIGCGWGALACHMAKEHGAHVTALTLSPSQRAVAVAAAEAQGVADRVSIELTDYRDATGSYDAVASVEMVEAVGRQYWPAYLDAIAARLRPGGRAAIQYIMIQDDVFEAYARSVDFIQAYVFPGGMLLSESRFRALAEARGLEWRDRHGFGLDYAETLRRWRIAFDTAVEEGRLPHEFDRDFVDLWRYYLMYCEGGFRGGGIDVAQVTLVKKGAA
ncbi:class I SAM-dependent methyltransferase [Sphingomonas gilva]|uniref:Class I SAM-dependent methyltransferase n=1 Tax=Sphingomonas gilva TaxID=2305907 RepID=A0A396S0P0_9SPHN|nr:class I SAM-dependent methyltransferase [Sphingomonas gilva]